MGQGTNSGTMKPVKPLASPPMPARPTAYNKAGPKPKGKRLRYSADKLPPRSVEFGPLQVGDQVSIKPGEPQDGCLAENEIGQVMEVSQDEDDDEPYKVLAASGKSLWYEDGQLVKVIQSKVAEEEPKEQPDEQRSTEGEQLVPPVEGRRRPNVVNVGTGLRSTEWTHEEPHCELRSPLNSMK